MVQDDLAKLRPPFEPRDVRLGIRSGTEPPVRGGAVLLVKAAGSIKIVATAPGHIRDGDSYSAAIVSAEGEPISIGSEY